MMEEENGDGLRRGLLSGPSSSSGEEFHTPIPASSSDYDESDLSILESQEYLLKDTEEDQGSSRYGISSIRRYFGLADYGILLAGVGSAVCFGAIPPFQARLMGNIFSGSSGHERDALHDNITENVPKLLVLGAVAFVSGYMQLVLLSILAERVVKRIKRECLNSLLRQDIAYFDEKSTGQLATLLSEQTQNLLKGIGESVGTMFQFGSQMIISYIIAFQTNSRVAGTLMGVVPILSIMVVILIVLAVKTFRKLDKVNEEAGGFAEETLSAMQTVAAFTGEVKSILKYDEILERAEKYGMKLVIIRSVGASFLFLVLYCTFGLSYWYGSTLIADFESDFGSVLTTVFTCIIGAMSVGAAVPVVQSLGQSKTAVNALFGIIDREPEMELYGTCKDSMDGLIEFKNVSFKYPNRAKIVLRDVSFAVLPGKSTALVGHSGCGKSTCIALLQRFFDPLAGTIEINGIRIQDFDLHYLRSNIALVQQEPVLFASTIKENIWLGLPGEPDMDLIVEAAKMANAHGFIMAFPDQYDTQCGSFGTQVSGGQKQRISIARALIRKPLVLLLDEATSALDMKSEAAVQKAIDKVLQTKRLSTVIIAHRLSTIRNCDQIVVFGEPPDSHMEGSTILERGTHEELIQIDNGIYKGMLETAAGGGPHRHPHPVSQTGNVNDVDDNAVKPLNRLPSQEEYLDLQMECLVPGEDELALEFVRSTSMMSFSSDSSSVISSPRTARSSSFASPVSKVNIASVDEDEGGDEPMYPVSQTRLWAEMAPEFVYLIIGIIAAGIKGGINPLTSIILSNAFTGFVIVPLVVEPNRTCTEDDDCNRLNDEFCGRFVDDKWYCCNGYFPGHGPDDVRSAGLETFLLYGLIGLGMGIAMYANFQSFGWASQRLTHRLKLKMFQSYMRMDAAFYDDPKNQVGILVARLATDPILVQNVTSDFYAIMFENFFAVSVGLGLAFAASWRMTLVIFLPCGLLMLSSFIRVRQHAQKKVNTDSESGRVINQALSSVRTVYSCTAEETILTYYSKYLDESLRAGIRNANVSGLQNGLSQCLFQIVYAFSFYYGAHMLNEGGDNGIDPKSLSRVFFVLTLTAQGVGQSVAKASDTSKAAAAISNIYKLLDTRKAIDYSSSEGVKDVALRGDVQFEGVSFAYPTRPTALVLRNFDLSIRSGEVIAFAGASGSGKSSIVRLLERFYDPLGGNILLDGRDLRSYNLAFLREQIGLVGQEPILFQGSVFENVAYGLAMGKHGNKSHEELLPLVIAACKSANAHNFIMDFPGGYDTPCGAKGVSLSGGQKQRIALARCLIKDPSILILDEATSALDAKSEAEVQKALDALMQARQRTTICVAHRLSTIRSADRIVVMERGKIVQVGNHDELINVDEGPYYKLYHQQI